VIVVILGSGTSVPHPERRPPAFLLQYEDIAVLLDCGAGSTTTMASFGVDLEQLSGILLTHTHLDHTAELIPLLFSLKNPVGPKRDHLPLWGPRGLGGFVQRVRDALGSWVSPPGLDLEINELSDRERVRIGPVTITAFYVHHGDPALAYRVDVADKTICYSGDSGPCDALVEAARGADLFVCECGVLEQEQRDTHLDATQVGELAAAAGCRKVVLTHLYERVVDSDPLARVRAAFDGEVILGADGMVFEAAEPSRGRST
jgi:ribonuclease BN (tRNA processing enzyme)